MFALDSDERIIAAAPAYVGPPTANSDNFFSLLVIAGAVIGALLFRYLQPAAYAAINWQTKLTRRGLLIITTRHLVFFIPEVEGSGLIYFEIEDILGIELAKKIEAPTVTFYVRDGAITRNGFPKGKLLSTSQDIGVSKHRIARWVVQKVREIRHIEVWEPLAL